MTTWNLNGTRKHVLICNGSSCMRKGGEEVTQAMRGEITARNLDAVVHTTRTRCNGRCKDAPVVIVYPDGTWYGEVDEMLAKEIVTAHIEQGSQVDELVCYVTKETGMQLQNNRPLGISKEKITQA
ncbi:(2Fe-2S) ferredoxin domain-containing protein [Peribacillus saganii]|uniref:(2Fe-2S) ferredoxin domain-containing protein n=1 Tax=Peribacillus saganii TaxID=2303992 RepID=A0A372LE34_9BACI|nr:(2Fe-2S) ferredoxin domain-containing protein [Peribacillus saganii]RFU64514.1 (2Fe-2S) ferredoxin domain-containing protein [Peribacillus saganii]